MDTLISMREFVLQEVAREFHLTDAILDHAQRFDRCVEYAKFLSQPLTLSMFVPCDDEGNVLEEPEKADFNDGMGFDGVVYQKCCDRYKLAKSKVIFEGFEAIYRNDGSGSVSILNTEIGFQAGYWKNVAKYLTWDVENMESLLKYSTEIKLTETAKKQIFG